MRIVLFHHRLGHAREPEIRLIGHGAVLVPQSDELVIKHGDELLVAERRESCHVKGNDGGVLVLRDGERDVVKHVGKAKVDCNENGMMMDC